MCQDRFGDGLFLTHTASVAKLAPMGVELGLNSYLCLACRIHLPNRPKVRLSPKLNPVERHPIQWPFWE